MAKISIEELYRGEGGGEKYGVGGIMGAVIKDLFTNGVPSDYFAAIQRALPLCRYARYAVSDHCLSGYPMDPGRP